MGIHDWLQHVKPGDEVIVCAGGVSNFQEIKRVARVTATQILIGSGAHPQRFRKKDGWQPGEGYSRNYLRQYDAETADEIRLGAARRVTYHALNNIKRCDVERLTSEECAQVLALLKACDLLEHP